MKILAIESSCDETAAAVVENGRTILSSVVNSQIDIHRRYGGVVPEIASRAHTEALTQVTQDALTQAGLGLDGLDALAVTYTPGLVGALLAGVSFAKGLRLTTGLPLIGVNHMRGHIAAAYLAHPDLEPPFVALVLSGGHTSLIRVNDYTDFTLIGRTRDDAAGEAFDKVARVLGIGYPGGKELEALARTGNGENCPLPSVAIKDHPFDFSFSGLKTAVINRVHNSTQKGEELLPQDLAAGFTQAVCRGLKDRLENLFAAQSLTRLVLCGGVAANLTLREYLNGVCRAHGVELLVPPLSLCGDNAAMIGAQAYWEYQAGNLADSSLNACPTGQI